MPYMDMFEEVDYKGRLSFYLEQQSANGPRLFFLGDGFPPSVSCRLVLFDEDVDQLWFVQRLSHRNSNVDMKCWKRRTHARGDLLDSWHDIEA